MATDVDSVHRSGFIAVCTSTLIIFVSYSSSTLFLHTVKMGGLGNSFVGALNVVTNKGSKGCLKLFKRYSVILLNIR